MALLVIVEVVEKAAILIFRHRLKTL